MIKITFSGNIGQDCQVKKVGDSTVCEFSVGCQSGYGERAKTEWFKCSIWGKRAENVKLTAGLTKGQQVFVTGEFTTSEYVNKDGKTIFNKDCRVDDFAYGKPPNLENVKQPSQQQNTPPANQQMGSHQQQLQPPGPHTLQQAPQQSQGFGDFDDYIPF